MQAGDMKQLIPVLKSAKEYGLKLALHIAEVCVLNTMEYDGNA